MPGYITKRSKDSWTVAISLGKDPETGKLRQRWKTVRGTKKDTEALLVQLLHQRDSSIDEPPGKLTVKQYLEKWLTSYAQTNAALKTFRTDADIIRRHLVPTLGALPLTKLRPMHIQGYYASALTSAGATVKAGCPPGQWCATTRSCTPPWNGP